MFELLMVLLFWILLVGGLLCLGAALTVSWEWMAGRWWKGGRNGQR